MLQVEARIAAPGGGHAHQVFGRPEGPIEACVDSLGDLPELAGGIFMNDRPNAELQIAQYKQQYRDNHQVTETDEQTASQGCQAHVTVGSGR